MKYFTDGIKVVDAPHRAGAFDKLQEIYGHSDIGDIFTTWVHYSRRGGHEDVLYRVAGHVHQNYYQYNPNENPWEIKS